MDEFIWETQNRIAQLIELVIIGVTLFAFVNSLLWRPDAYDAASKWHKKGWCITLFIGVVITFVPLIGFMIIKLGFLVAALVYIVDVRPALKSLYHRKR